MKIWIHSKIRPNPGSLILDLDPGGLLLDPGGLLLDPDPGSLTLDSVSETLDQDPGRLIVDPDFKSVFLFILHRDE